MATERVGFELTLTEDRVPEPKITGAHRYALHTATAAANTFIARYVFCTVDTADAMELITKTVAIASDTHHTLAVPITFAMTAVATDVGMADPVGFTNPVLSIQTFVAGAVVFTLAAVPVPFGKVGCLMLDVALNADVALTAVRAFGTATAPHYCDVAVRLTFRAAVAHYANTAVVRASATGATEFFFP